MDDAERVRRGMLVRREVLGDEHVDRAVAATTPFTEPFQDFITRYAWGDIWSRPGLSRAERSIVTLSVLAALAREHELAMHVKAALRNGLTPEQIQEVLLQVAVYAGVPVANRAFPIAERALADAAEAGAGPEAGPQPPEKLPRAPNAPSDMRTCVLIATASAVSLAWATERRDMAEIVSLAEAVERAIQDGDAVAMEGFTHLIPFAAGHEVIRQRRRDLTLIRMTPDLIYDQLIGAGCVRKLIFSWGGNPGVGSLHRFRDAVENSWPVALELEEHSHAGMANRYVAGASGVPFAVLRGYNGTGLEAVGGGRGAQATTGSAAASTIAPITCPFTGERLTAVAAIRPDVTVIHAQRADRSGNVQLWGITGVQKEAVLAARRSVVTVEEIVDELDARPDALVLPAWTVSYVAPVPGGAHPSYALGYSVRDNDYYVAWDAIARDRDAFSRWLEDQVYRVPARQP
jgi:glutaconate CoA-transferase, subunit A